MNLTLKERLEENVIVFYEKTKDQNITNFLPLSSSSLEDTLNQFKESKLPNANSYGKCIYFDDEYIGDIWAYGKNLEESPNFMISFCIFNSNFWNKGIATKALEKFLIVLKEKYPIESVGAFIYKENKSSFKVLLNNGFLIKEVIIDNEIEDEVYKYSLYLEKLL